MVDYSKWKNIEISDDEDETHPNIDTPSLFRWRHNARIERMEEFNKKKQETELAKNDVNEKLRTLSKSVEEERKMGSDVTKLETELRVLEGKYKELLKKDEELKMIEKSTPWNVDTISQPGFSKTVMNTSKPKVKEELSEEELQKRFDKFVKDNEKLLQQYGMMRKYEDSKRFLLEHPHLVCEDTPNYLVVYCIRLEMDEKHNLMSHVAHQAICMQYIMELAKQLEVDPRSCVSNFFARIQDTDNEYRAAFEAEIEAFKSRIVHRAQEKLDIAMKEAEEEERHQRLGPGGLDPLEVIETLPPELKECFERKDVPLLKETIDKMDKELATYHMRRCVDSGLWIPDTRYHLDESEDDNDIYDDCNEQPDSESPKLK